MAAGSEGGKATAPKRNNPARLFGYDVFISFSLGQPPRGTRSYASDLARRLRELAGLALIALSEVVDPHKAGD